MDVKTSIREDGDTEVTITVPASIVDEQIKAHYKDLSKARIPGFRPGKAPRAIIDQNFGGHEAVFAEITQEVINVNAPKAVDSQDILFIGSAKFDETEPVVEGQDYTFTLHATAKPELEIENADAVKIEMPPAEATEAELEKQINAMREYYYSFETVEEAAKTGDFVQLSMAVTKSDGSKVQGLNSESRLLELGSGTVPASFDEQVCGMKAGDTKSFDFSIAGDDAFSYVGEDELHAEVEVKEVRVKVMPEVGDELAKKVGFENMEEFRAKMTEAIQNQKDQQLPALKEQRCIDELAKRVKGEVPQAYIDFTRQDIAREFFTNMQQQGVTMDQFLQQQGITMEEFNNDLNEESKEVATQNVALDALAREKKFEVTEEDLDAEFQVVENPEEVRKTWEENGRMSELREAIRRRKAVEWLVENAEVTIVEIEDEGDGSEEE